MSVIEMPRLNSVVENIPEALSIFINQIVYEKKAAGEKVYTFSLGEAFFNIPRFNFSDEQFFQGYHYSSSMGQLKLRQCISSMYKSFYDVETNPETEIIISTGSKPIIFMILQTILNNGEEVLIQEPAWVSYKAQISLAGGKYVAIPYNEDLYSWERYISSKTKVIILNNPNNPSGRLFSKDELKYLWRLACKYNIFILSDEAYSDFLLEDKFVSFANIDKTKEHCLVVNSLSKNMGMSGWRVGYAIAHEKVIYQLLKVNQHLITCAPTVLQDYMAEHFYEILSITMPQAKLIAKKRKAVKKIMDQIGLQSLKGEGTFYFFIDVSDFVGTTDELVYTLLFDYNIATVPGKAYGETTERFIRFGIGVENLQDITKSLVIIKNLLSDKEIDLSGTRRKMRERGISC